MMKKIFNKKTAKLYIALICVAFIFTVTSSGFCIHYSLQYTKLEKESSSSSSLSDTVSSVLGSLVNAQSGNKENADETSEAISSAISSFLGDKDKENEAVKNEELKAAQNKKLWSTVVTVVFAVLLVAFSACTITSYQYEKYLESPKYKAKLKRMKKADKAKAN